MSTVTGRQNPALLVLAVSLMLWGCAPSTNSGSATSVRVTAVSGVSVPHLNELARELEGARRELSGMRTFVRENGKRVEAKRSRPMESRSAVVRSFDATTGLAYVQMHEYPEYRMPLLQIWHFDGKAWSDSVDRGIFIRSPLRAPQ
jgi:hypothetical protein